MDTPFREFEDRYSLPAIVAVVRQRREELQASSEDSPPELRERLARQRLTTSRNGVS